MAVCPGRADPGRARSSYSGVLGSLRSISTPWNEKLKLSQKLLNNPSQIIPNKHQMLLDWACQEMINFTSKDNQCNYPPSMIDGLWQFIHEVIKQCQVKNGNQNLPLSVKPYFAEVIRKTFRIDNDLALFHPSAVECCRVIFVNNELSKPLTAKFEGFVNILSNFLDFVVFELDKISGNSVASSGNGESLLTLAGVLLERYVKLQRQQTNQKKVFVGLCEILLYRLAILESRLGEQKRGLSTDEKTFSDCLSDKIRNIVGSTIVHKDHLTGFQSYLKNHVNAGDTSDGNKKAKFSEYIDSLFSLFKQILPDEDDNMTAQPKNQGREIQQIFDLVSYMFECFVKLITGMKQMKYQLGFKFFHTLCVAFKIEKFIVTGEYTTEAVVLLMSLLKLVADFDIYNAIDDATSDHLGHKLLAKITKELLSSLHQKCSVEKLNSLRCCQYLELIDHTLLEAYLPQIWVECMKTENTDSGSENIMLSKAKDELLCCVLNTYVKLRQVDKLISYFLESLQQNVLCEGDNTKSPQIPEQFSIRFIEILSMLPPGQAISIWEKFIKEIEANYLNVVRDLAGKKLKRERLARMCWIGSRFECLASTFSLVGLHSQFVLSSGRTSLRKERFLELVKETEGNIINPLVELCSRLPKEVEQSYCRSALMLLHCIYKLMLFLAQHRIQTTPDSTLEWSETLTMFLPNSAWTDIHCIRNDPCCIYLMNAVAIDQMRLTGYANKVLCHVLQTMNHTISNLKNKQTACWNGQIWQITTSNITTALTRMILSNLPIFDEMLDRNYYKKLAEFFLNIMPSVEQYVEGEKRVAKSFPSITCAYQVLSFLQSTDFYECYNIQTAYCDVLTTHSVDVFTENGSSKLIDLLLTIPNQLETKLFLESDIMNDEKEKRCHEIDKGNEHCLSDEGNKNGIDETELTPGDSIVDLEPQLTPGDSIVHLEPPHKNLKAICDNFLKILFRDSGEEKEMSKNVTSVQKYFNLLKACRLLAFEWLLPNNLLKIVLIITFIQKEILQVSEPTTEIVSVMAHAFQTLSTIAEATLSINRMSLWSAMDPASLLLWVIQVGEKFKEQRDDDLNIKVVSAVLHVTRCLLTVKRPDAHDVILSVLIRKFSDISKSLHTLPLERKVMMFGVVKAVLAVTADVIRERSVKKYSVRTAIMLFLPLAEYMFSILSKDKCTSEEPFNIDELKGSIISCHANIFTVCVSVKVSRKYVQLSRSLDLLQWQQHFPHVLVFVMRNINETIESGSMWSSVFEDCMDFLSKVYTLPSITETWQLTDLDFTKSLLASLSTMAIRNLKDSENEENTSKRRNSLYKIINDVIHCLAYDDRCTLLEEITHETERSFDNLSRLTLNLEIWNFILTAKWKREEKQSFKVNASKLLHTCTRAVGILRRKENDRMVVVALSVVTKLLGFCKEFLAGCHATSALHACLLSRSQKLTNTRSCALFMEQISLLSELLFHHPQSTYGVIHSYIACMKLLLTDLITFYNNVKQDNQVMEEELEMSVVDKCGLKFARLYQEIGSHKQAISKYSPYIIADYIRGVQMVRFTDAIEAAMIAGIYSIMDACSDYEFALLNIVLDQGEQELFKDLHNGYTKYYKFKGKT